VIWGKNTAFFATSMSKMFDDRGAEVVNLTDLADHERRKLRPDPFRLLAVGRRLDAAHFLLSSGHFTTFPHALRRVVAVALRWTSQFVGEFSSALTILWISVRFDAVIFSRGITITQHRYEWSIYRLFGCRTVVMLHGSEARPPYLNGAVCPEGVSPDIDRLAQETDRRWSRLARIEKYADVIVGSPGVAHFLTREVIDRDIVGFPIAANADSVRDCIEAKLDSVLEVPRVLHAPSRRAAKGTESLRRAFDELRDEGFRFDLDWNTEWISHTDLLQRISRSHIVVDQLYADVPGGVLATESMALGAVAVVGSPVAPWLRQRYASDGVPPALLVSPHEIKEELRSLLSDPVERQRRAKAAYLVMATDFDVAAVATRWEAILFGEAENAWFFDPEEIDLVIHGFAPTEHLRSVTRKFIEERGTSALRLSGNPKLERLVLDFALGQGAPPL